MFEKNNMLSIKIGITSLDQPGSTIQLDIIQFAIITTVDLQHFVVNDKDNNNEDTDI